MNIILIGLWALFTFIMFCCCRQHNESTDILWLKATWEPYVFSFGLGAVIILGLVT